MNVFMILSQKFADKKWSLDGDDYSGLEWLDDSPKPSEKQLEDLWPDVEYEVACDEVKQARRAAYVSQSDPLFFGYQRGENTEQDWLDAVEAVKDALPYPEKPKE
jgi:hypothetical protein